MSDLSEKIRRQKDYIESLESYGAGRISDRILRGARADLDYLEMVREREIFASKARADRAWEIAKSKMSQEERDELETQIKVRKKFAFEWKEGW